MRQAFFTDRENGPIIQDKEDIPFTVFNGCISLYNKYKLNFAGDFPEYCPDGDSIICGFNENQFKQALLAVIPDFTLSEYGHIIAISNEDEYNQYALLDFVEFCWMHIKKATVIGNHNFFGHQHYEISDGKLIRNEYVDDVNQMFQRNGLAYEMKITGHIDRILPAELDVLIRQIKHYGSDNKLNELIDLAVKKIYQPDVLDRQVALEKLWDAYERMKTYYVEKNKKLSANQLIHDVSEGSTLFEEYLQDEFKTLTSIGNGFRIRHHETDKAEIISTKHLDYLFYRMLALISLVTAYLR